MNKTRTLVFAVLSIVSLTAQSTAAQDSCEAKVRAKAPDLKRVDGPYTSAMGDFDGDNKEDTAFFIEKPKDGKSRAVAVCLSSRADALLITDLYVNESLSVSKKGTSFYNFETNKEDAYPSDGISVSCCECCGATYLYSNGTFYQVVDSD